MRTKLRLEDTLLEQARHEAARRHETLTSLSSKVCGLSSHRNIDRHGGNV
jgi:hypothetical protein